LTKPRACELCGSEDRRRLHVENGFDIVRCQECRHVYVDPRPTPEALAGWYQKFFVDLDAGAIDAWHCEMSGVFRHVRAVVRSEDKASGIVLDIGCSYGFLLDLFETPRWTREGIELSVPAAAYARSLTAGRIFERPLEELNLADDYYDVVTCIYVMEHVWDPFVTLRAVHRILKPGGVFIAAVPQTVPMYVVKKMLKLDLLNPPFHLRDYSPATLGRFWQSAGFTAVRIGPVRPMLSPNRLENALLKINDRLSRTLHGISGGRWMTPVGGKLVVARKESAR
jgi:SAM-dependent methyltransferase